MERVRSDELRRVSTYLEFSWKTPRSLSRSPDASASRFRGGRRVWFGGTIDSETWRGSPR